MGCTQSQQSIEADNRQLDNVEFTPTTARMRSSFSPSNSTEESTMQAFSSAPDSGNPQAATMSSADPTSSEDPKTDDDEQKPRDQTLGIPELLEQILLEVSPQDILLNAQRVSKGWKQSIDHSIGMKVKLWNKVSSDDSSWEMVGDESAAGPVTKISLNPLVFKDSENKTTKQALINGAIWGEDGMWNEFEGPLFDSRGGDRVVFERIKMTDKCRSTVLDMSLTDPASKGLSVWYCVVRRYGDKWYGWWYNVELVGKPSITMADLMDGAAKAVAEAKEDELVPDGDEQEIGDQEMLDAKWTGEVRIVFPAGVVIELDGETYNEPTTE